MRALSEVDAAAKLGFRRFRDFTRAVRRGAVPGPDRQLPDGPRWSETALDAWLSGELDGRSLGDEERQLIEELEGAAHPPLRAQGPARR